MKRKGSGALAVLSALALAGCGGSAVLIHHTARGGTLGLEGDREQAMADARRQMSEACGGAYAIVAQRYVAAGAYHGRPLTEHQLRYRCGTEPDGLITPRMEP